MRPLIAFVAVLLWQTIALSLEPLTVQMLDISNSLRERANVRTAALDPCLCSAAQSHANRLAYLGFGPSVRFADPHNWVGNGTPGQRAAAAGFRGTLDMPPGPDGWSTTGEIIAPRYTADVNSPFQGWLDSAGHRKSLLYGGFDRCGFGHARNGRGESIFVALYGAGSRAAARSSEAAGPATASAPAAFYVNGGPIQGPVQAQVQACGPGGCGPAKAYYQPRRGVRAFGGCGGGRGLPIVRRFRR